MTIEDAWKSVLAASRRQKPKLASSPKRGRGATDRQLAAMAEQLGVEVPSSLLRLLSLAKPCELHPGWTLLSPRQIVAERRGLIDEHAARAKRGIAALEGADSRVEQTFWARGWIPFAADFAGSFLAIDTTPAPGGHAGQVVEMVLTAPERTVIADSLEQHLGRLAERLRSGRYRSSEDGVLIDGVAAEPAPAAPEPPRGPSPKELLDAGRVDEAIAAFDALPPQPWAARLNFAYFLNQAGQGEEALRRTDALARTDPQPAVLSSHAEMLTARERWAEAADAYGRLASVHSNAASHGKHGAALLKAGRPDDALDAFRRGLAAGGREAEFAYNAACALAMKGDIAGGLQSLGRAIELMPALKEHARGERELEPLRTDPAFADLVVGS